MDGLRDLIESMLMIEPEMLVVVVSATMLITTAITGTLKIQGWNKLFVTISVYTIILLMYIFRDNEIVRWITTYVVGLGSATGLYQILRKPKATQQKLSGGQTTPEGK